MSEFGSLSFAGGFARSFLAPAAFRVLPAGASLTCSGATVTRSASFRPRFADNVVADARDLVDAEPSGFFGLRPRFGFASPATEESRDGVRAAPA